MKAIPLIILAILLFLYINIEISSSNPCSSFSQHQSLCTSDNIEQE
jgi:hypothetical protein